MISWVIILMTTTLNRTDQVVSLTWHSSQRLPSDNGYYFIAGKGCASDIAYFDVKSNSWWDCEVCENFNGSVYFWARFPDDWVDVSDAFGRLAKLYGGEMSLSRTHILVMSEWVRTEDELPPKEGLYFVFSEDGEYGIAYFDKNATCWRSNILDILKPCSVLFWSTFPKLPRFVQPAGESM